MDIFGRRGCYEKLLTFHVKCLSGVGTVLRLGKTELAKDEQTHLGGYVGWHGVPESGGEGSEEAGNHRLQCTRNLFLFTLQSQDLMSNIPSGRELM